MLPLPFMFSISEVWLCKLTTNRKPENEVQTQKRIHCWNLQGLPAGYDDWFATHHAIFGLRERLPAERGLELNIQNKSLQICDGAL
jgi:hypothetical protein